VRTAIIGLGVARRILATLLCTLDIFIWAVLLAVHPVAILSEKGQTLVQVATVHFYIVGDVGNGFFRFLSPEVRRHAGNWISPDVQIVFIVFHDFTSVFERTAGNVDSSVNRSPRFVFLM
jgi:hypothetical protein